MNSKKKKSVLSKSLDSLIVIVFAVFLYYWLHIVMPTFAALNKAINREVLQEKHEIYNVPRPVLEEHGSSDNRSGW